MQIVNVSFTINDGNIRHTVLRLQSGSRQATINEAMEQIAALWNVSVIDVQIVRLS